MPTRRTNEDLSFLDHLEELRFRIIRVLIALVLGVVVGYFLAPWPLDWMTYPLVSTYERLEAKQPEKVLQIEVGEQGEMRLRNNETLSDIGNPDSIEFYEPDGEEAVSVWQGRNQQPLLYLRPMDPFVIRLKAALFIGILLSMPVIIYQLWAFISPGLHSNERRFALPVVFTGTVLFPVGATFAYFLLEVTLRFFTQFIMENAVPFNDARAYLSFVLTMMLSFGIIFELPLVVVLATRAGLVTVDWLAERRKIVFVLLLVAAAIITPSGDPITLMALTAPLYVLFEGSLLVSRMLEKSQAAEEDSSRNDPEASSQ